jgi:cysteinyl-tRNA synthetase
VFAGPKTRNRRYRWRRSNGLIEERQAAAAARFAAADGIRKDLEGRGILLEDNAAGTRWKRK